MLILALHLATASIELPPPSQPSKIVVLPDGGTKRRDGKDDEDVR